MDCVDFAFLCSRKSGLGIEIVFGPQAPQAIGLGPPQPNHLRVVGEFKISGPTRRFRYDNRAVSMLLIQAFSDGSDLSLPVAFEGGGKDVAQFWTTDIEEAIRPVLVACHTRLVGRGSAQPDLSAPE
jgi:hypothetical protein